MFMDEDLPKPKDKGPQPKNLEPLGQAELKDYLAYLGEEVKRTEAEIARKQKIADAAKNFFK